MAVKYFDKIKKAWLPFPGTVGEKGDAGRDGADGKDGKGAYQIAKENGYTGSEDEFNEALGNIGQIPDIELPDVDAMPTAGSKNLVESGGVYKAIQDIKTDIESGSGGGNVINGLTKEEADGLYEPILNVDKTLFTLNGTEVKYLSRIDIEGGDVEIKVPQQYTFFVYKATEDNIKPSISGGSVKTQGDNIVAYAPLGWEVSPNSFMSAEHIWMSVGTFIVDGDQVGDWSDPIPYATGGVAGQDGDSVEFIYTRMNEKLDAYPAGAPRPNKDWDYQSAELPWTNDPVGVSVEYKTEFVSVRFGNKNSIKGMPWSQPVVWSVFGEDGKDGGTVEYIYTVNNHDDFAEYAIEHSLLNVDNTVSEAIPEPYKLRDEFGVETEHAWIDDWGKNGVKDILSNDLKYVWCSKRVKNPGDSTWGEFQRPMLWAYYSLKGTAGDAGFSVANVSMYQRSDDIKVSIPEGSLYYNFITGDVYVDESGRQYNGDWKISPSTDNTGKYLLEIRAYVHSDKITEETPYCEITNWEGPFIISANGKDGSGQSVLDVSIDPDTLMLPVRSNNKAHQTYEYQVQVSHYYGLEKLPINNCEVSYNSSTYPDIVVAKNDLLSDNENMYHVYDITVPADMVAGSVIPINFKLTSNVTIKNELGADEEKVVTTSKYLSVIPTVTDNPYIYAIRFNKNQIVCKAETDENGVKTEGQYIKPDVIKYEGKEIKVLTRTQTEADNLVLMYTTGSRDEDDVDDWDPVGTIDDQHGEITDGEQYALWVDYTNYDEYGHEIIFGLFQKAQFTDGKLNANEKPFLYNVVSLVGAGEDGKDGTNIEYWYYLEETTEIDSIVPGYISEDGRPFAVPMPEVDENGNVISDYWIDNPTGIDANHRIEWYIKRISPYGTNKWEDFTGPYKWSVWGKEGTDGPGCEYIFKHTLNTDVPEIPSYGNVDSSEDNFIPSGWEDNAIEPTDTKAIIWMAMRKKVNGTWGSFSNPIIWNRFAAGRFKSIVFTRTDQDLSQSTVEGGSYDSPIPTSTTNSSNIEWTDSIPDGDMPVWSCQCTFELGNDFKADWSYPVLISDTPDIEYMFSKDESYNEIPDGFKKSGTSIDEEWLKDANEAGWYDEPNEFDGDAIWMAITKKSHGSWSNWTIHKIKGEDGVDGKDGLWGQTKVMYYCVPRTYDNRPDTYYSEWTSYDETYGYMKPAYYHDDDGNGIWKSEDKVHDAGWFEDYAKVHSDFVNAKKSDDKLNFMLSMQITYKYGEGGSLIGLYPGEINKVTTTIGQGQDGKIIYPGGSYQQWIKDFKDEKATDIKADSKSAPYFTDTYDGSKKYYVYNSEVEWSKAYPGYESIYLQSIQDEWEDFDTYWIEMDSFNAIQTEILIADNGTVGGAVFNKNYMFSKSGSGSGYESFVATDNPYSEDAAFKPNTLINFNTGDAYFGMGSVKLATTEDDGSIFDKSIRVGDTTIIDKGGLSVAIENTNVTIANDKVIVKYGNNGFIIDNDGIKVNFGNETKLLSDYIYDVVFGIAGDPENTETKTASTGFTASNWTYTRAAYKDKTGKEPSYSVLRNGYTALGPINITLENSGSRLESVYTDHSYASQNLSSISVKYELQYSYLKTEKDMKLFMQEPIETRYYGMDAATGLNTTQAIQMHWADSEGNILGESGINDYIGYSFSEDGTLTITKKKDDSQNRYAILPVIFKSDDLMPDCLAITPKVNILVFVGSNAGVQTLSL